MTLSRQAFRPGPEAAWTLYGLSSVGLGQFEAWTPNLALERLIDFGAIRNKCPGCIAIAGAYLARNSKCVEPWITEDELEHIENCWGTTICKTGREW